MTELPPQADILKLAADVERAYFVELTFDDGGILLGANSCELIALALRRLAESEKP